MRAWAEPAPLAFHDVDTVPPILVAAPATGCWGARTSPPRTCPASGSWSTRRTAPSTWPPTGSPAQGRKGSGSGEGRACRRAAEPPGPRRLCRDAAPASAVANLAEAHTTTISYSRRAALRRCRGASSTPRRPLCRDGAAERWCGTL